MDGHIDWSFAETHMWSRHRILVSWAREAVRDPRGLTLDPDPAGRSGSSIRLIGYSQTTNCVLAVIMVRFQGALFAASAWKANREQTRMYREGVRNHD